MSATARLNRRFTQLAVGRHLPHRTVRRRLTLLYGGLFLLSGAALMAIAYALLVNAGFVFSLQSGTNNAILRRPPASALPGTGPSAPASAQTMAHWTTVARCMRAHGVSEFPNPTSSAPPGLPLIHKVSEVSDRDGAFFAIPSTIDMQSPAFAHATTACGFMADYTRAAAVDRRRRTHVLQELLIQSGIALAGMSLLSILLGWFVAGRVLQPLEDAYEAQRQFVANASHELRAPLTRQRALIEVALASSQADVDSLRTAHERVLASEQHLEQLIDALLALSRGEAGLERREPLDLAVLASQAMLARDPPTGELDIRATLAAAPTDGDPRLLERLIANLLDNAIRHNVPGGHVEVSTGTRDQKHAFVSVANTGPTVPPEQLQRLFEPFERLGGARTRHDGGHGLGLSIVQAIAGAHGAELSTRARPQGGLHIEVSFPPPAGAGSGPTLTAAPTKRARPRAVPETDALAGP
ncbi:MAG TPA: HAMP domain-containing sensor histidine kinase [Solirubrobacteraceae bacterium]|jgi:signal transduction histidine kinase|nr:HAMP domain-containing sensor histidine kinase [Solirubrobacteraceae bacterium]